MSEVFKLEKVDYKYLADQIALQDISFSVSDGEILSIIGSNGSGKSTLLHLLSGLVFPSKGKILFNGTELNKEILKDNEFNRNFRSSIGYIFQNPESQLFCPTVMDELLFGPLQLQLSKEVAIQRSMEVATMLNIKDLLDRPPYMLSGGEKKRVAIAAVLTTNPQVLIMDEPMSGLDPKTRSFLIELIFKLNEAGKTMVIATHHLELVDHMQSRVIVLSEQHTIEKCGNAEDILKDTDLLIRTNLIHEHLHRHGSDVHKHLPKGFLFHRH
jgi:cobalt/nickel transport system ATP-binding protein